MKYRILCALYATTAALLTTPALAQQPPGHHESSAAPAPLGTDINDRILVAGSAVEAGATQSLTPGGQDWQQGQRQTIITRPEWRAAGREEAEFDRINGINRQMCVRNAVRFLRLADLARTVVSLTGLDDPLANRYIALGGKIQSAQGARQGTEVVQTGLGFLTGFLSSLGNPGVAAAYGGGVAVGNIGNEAQGQVHDEAMLLNRDVGVYGLVATVANIKLTLVGAEGNLDYWEHVDERYCNPPGTH